MGHDADLAAVEAHSVGLPTKPKPGFVRRSA
jgi:hypothetical protein